MTAGLFVGRFQPFHNGHLKAIEWALAKCGKMIIVIGSAQSGMEPENPFTAGEREEMVGKVLEARGWEGRCTVISIEDVNNHLVWVSHVESKVPKYDAIYSNSPLTIKLFKNAGK
ncbi:MAG: nicotinamide-nucleotide adenylyltransferase, partial [Candidatus Micrarchaeota archaeon]|nr:nicotinamide-nucleotide adenylyltransferase [Candidatus Micrarchaeota archaeon]